MGPFIASLRWNYIFLAAVGRCCQISVRLRHQHQRDTMGPLPAAKAARLQHRRTAQAGRAGGIVLVAVFLLLAAAGSAIWLYHAAHRRAAEVAGAPGGSQLPALCESTKAVLDRLEAPVAIHFYALLDPATVPESDRAFAGRVGQMLAAYEQQAAGKIKVTTFDSQSNANANDALADGITAFNSEKGEACYLGVALVLNGHKETLPRLSSDWEQALEPDLTRALIRLEDAARPASVPAAISQVNTAALQQVRTLITNLAAVSVQEGSEILREAALQDFAAAAQEMQTQVKEAEQRLLQAQHGGTEAEQQAAMKHLQQVQADNTEKLKQIAAQSKAQIDIFQQLKAASH